MTNYSAYTESTVRTLPYFASLICMMAFAVACDDESESEDSDKPVAEKQEQATPNGDDDTASEGLHPIWGEWTPDDDLEALQGEWQVSRSGLPDYEWDEEWKVDGDEAVVYGGQDPTSDADIEDTRREGTIETPFPGVVKFSVPSESSEQILHYDYSFAREGDEFYLGTGHAGVVLSDRYVFRRSDNLLVYRDGECKYHEEDIFGDIRDEAEAIDCELVDDGETKHLIYTDPDRREYGSSDTNRIEVSDEAIIDESLREERLQPL